MGRPNEGRKERSVILFTEKELRDITAYQENKGFLTLGACIRYIINKELEEFFKNH